MVHLRPGASAQIRVCGRGYQVWRTPRKTENHLEDGLLRAIPQLGTNKLKSIRVSVANGGARYACPTAQGGTPAQLLV
jgi:hypothetical protein